MGDTWGFGCGFRACGSQRRGFRSVWFALGVLDLCKQEAQKGKCDISLGFRV